MTDGKSRRHYIVSDVFRVCKKARRETRCAWRGQIKLIFVIALGFMGIENYQRASHSSGMIDCRFGCGM